MEFFTNDVMAGLPESSLDTAALGAEGFTDFGAGSGSGEGRYINWLTITDNAASVADDVRHIRNHPLVPGRIAIYGYLYDVVTGQLVAVPEAIAAGKAT